MTPMLTGLIVGTTITTGLLTVYRGVRPPKPALADVLRHAATRHNPTPDTLTGLLLGHAARTSDDDALDADLAALGRTRSHYASTRLQLATALGVLPVAATVATSMLAGASWNPFIVAVCATGGVIAGLALARTTLGSEASQARRSFNDELAAYLDVVAQLVAGGEGIDGALWRAARNANTPGLTMIRTALASARVRRRSEWAELDTLATRARLPELAELVTAIQLSASDGARIRASLQAKARSLRAASASEQLAAANRASELMGGPLIGMLLAFLAVVLAPALAQVLAIN